MTGPDLRDEVFRLAADLARGGLAPERGERLASLLEQSPEARRLWFQFHDIERGLAAWASPQRGEPAAATAARSPTPAARRSGQRYAVAAAAAAVLGAAWLAGRPGIPTPAAATPSSYVATLAGQQDCEWGRGAALRTGQRLAAGPLALTRGRALLHFDGGASLAVVAPAEVVVESPGGARVIRGTVAVHAPDEAVGFRLTTPQGTAVDLGTEFVVAVTAGGAAECQVLEGEVEWHSPRPSQAMALLSEGEARRFAGGRAEAIPSPPGRFADFLPREAGGGDGELLAYEPFDYPAADAAAETLTGGVGWRSPWRGRFVPTDKIDVDPRVALDPAGGLSAPGLAAGRGGSLAFGTAREYRLRALPAPLDFGADGVHYFSFLVRGATPLVSHGRDRGPFRLEFRSVTDYWTHTVGFSLGTEFKPLLFADGNNSAGGSPLVEGETAFVVCKVAASRLGADQMFMRVYPPGNPPEAAETTRWTVVGRDLRLDCALDHLVLAVPRCPGGRFDELRYGTTWRAVVPTPVAGDEPAARAGIVR